MYAKSQDVGTLSRGGNGRISTNAQNVAEAG